MDESNFEGTLVLEKMASIGKVDEFFEAIDADDFNRVKNLMKQAKLDAQTIASVMQQIHDELS